MGGAALTCYDLNQHIKLIEGIEESELTQSVFINFFNRNKGFDQDTNLLDAFDTYAQEIYKDTERLSEPNLSIQKEMRHEAFRKKLYKNIYEINHINDTFSLKLLDDVVDTLPNYSEYSFEKLVPEIRETAPYLILRLLNDGVWNKKGGGNNTIENIKVISHYILGDTGNKSLLEKLAKDRGVLGIYDMLHFKFSCNYSRGGDIWDVSRSLMWHKLTQNGKLSVDDEIVNQTNDKDTLEEATLAAFKIFKEAYIDTGLNLLQDFEDITDEAILGNRVVLNKKWFKQVQTEEKYKYRIQAIKSRRQVFTIYDLCLEGNYSGMRCGGYVFKGKKIKEWMQDYLFGTCFKSSNPANKELFVNFLLKCLKSTVGSHGDRDYASQEFSFNEITLILNRERILEYWKENDENIKDTFKNKQGEIVTQNYVAYYQENEKNVSDLSNPSKTGMFDILDIELEKYLKEKEKIKEDIKKQKAVKVATKKSTSKKAGAKNQ